MSAVKIIRLMSGEELIAKVSDSGLNYRLTDVVQTVTSVAPDKKLKVSFIPFMPIADTDKGFEINKNFCAFLIDPVESVLQSYNLVFQQESVVQQTQPTVSQPTVEVEDSISVPKRKGPKTKAAVVKPAPAFVKG